MHVELQVQLFAMCAVQAGEGEPKKNISQDIVINTEKDILHLPVTANILSTHQEMFHLLKKYFALYAQFLEASIESACIQPVHIVLTKY